MGTGIEMNCKQCGYKWIVLDGKGLNVEANINEATKSNSNDDNTQSPKCGSKDIEPNKEISILWD